MAQERQPIGTRDGRLARLECERGPIADELLERVVAKVREVRRDDVDALRDRCEEITVSEVDLHAVRRGVRARDTERGRGHIGRDQVQLRLVDGESDRDRS
jgi:hypothetical protein